MSDLGPQEVLSQCEVGFVVFLLLTSAATWDVWALVDSLRSTEGLGEPCQSKNIQATGIF